jgi:putative restriction endonuclease
MGCDSADNEIHYKVGDIATIVQIERYTGPQGLGIGVEAARIIPDVEFDRILEAGFAAELASPVDNELPSDLEEPIREFERPIVELTILRPFREQSFKRNVRTAYDNRCAFTGLRLINGGGRPEVQAAHIMPVASKGPDSIRNGLALSGTIHWMFDRGLVSIDEDCRIVTAKNGVPDQVRALFNPSGKLILPNDGNMRPHPHYLKFHREQVFKG